MEQGAVTFKVRYPPRLSRLLIFVKWLLLIPHFIVLYFYAIAVGITTFLAWWAILFTGKYPKGLYKFAVGFFRWQIRVSLYYCLLRDEYPPFSGA